MKNKFFRFSIFLMLALLFCFKLSFAGFFEQLKKFKLKKPVDFLYVDLDSKKSTREARDPLVVMEAEDYRKLFGYVPMERMLRSQIKKEEYIALNQKDLDFLSQHHNSIIENKSELYKIYFAKVGGIIDDTDIETRATLVSYGRLKDIILNTNRVRKRNKENEMDEVDFKGKKELELKSDEKHTEGDMPWMGL